MSMRPTREDPLIRLLLSAYENSSWADAALTKPDTIERTRQAVDQLATRKSDGKTLAIEHTIIEPFVSDKEDFATFQVSFLRIEEDESLFVPGRWMQVFVPVGTLQNQSQESRRAIVGSVHRWIKLNRLTLSDGNMQYPCPITEAPVQAPSNITLTVQVTRLEGSSVAARGSLHIRRQEVGNSLGSVIEKTLAKKLTKLTNIVADKRILLLERQHMNLFPERMLGEIDKQRASFADLAVVDEIWVVETMFYGTKFGGDYVRFSRYEGGNVVESFAFEHGLLISKFDNRQ